MPNYRRNQLPGGTFSFTVNLHDPRADLLVARIDRLRDAVRRVRAQRIDAWVFLPDHLHRLRTLPQGRLIGHTRRFVDAWTAGSTPTGGRVAAMNRKTRASGLELRGGKMTDL